MVSEKEKADPFRELRWSDIEEWAGAKTISKGEDYKRSGKVEEIKRTPKGGLIARVRGRNEYFTEVALENRKLSSTCTCPMGHNCKHGVATVLEYLDLLQQGIKVKLLSEKDPFLIKTRSGLKGPGAFEIRGQKSSSPLREWLSELNKEELIDILVEFAGKSPSLGSYLKDRQELSTESVEGITESIYSELDELWEEAEGYKDRQELSTESVEGITESIYSELDELWEEAEGYKPWDYSSELPDFSNVQARMESLLDSGQHEELLEIGKEIMERYEDIGDYDDEGEIAMEVSGCMDIVFESLSKSPRPAHERMLQVLEIELEDNYYLTGDHTFWKGDFSGEDWENYAKLLKTRLQEIDEGKFPDYSGWDRDRVADRLVEALKNAGLFEEAISICEHEAEVMGRYDRLVEVLLEAGRKEKAVEWVHKGLDATHKKNPGVSIKLRKILLEIKEKEGDLLFAAALQAEEFFKDPDFSSYFKIKETAEKAGVWQEVREMVHSYLEKGKLPKVRGKKREEASVLPGVLPATGLHEPDSFKAIEAPVLELLIKIAIEEKAPDEVIRWYEELKKISETEKRYGHYIDKNQIANTVHEKYPEIALEIWNKMAEELISKTNVDAYREAAVHLRKVKETMEAGRQKGKWKIYIQEIRDANKRKKRLMEILDTLEKDRIIEG